MLKHDIDMALDQHTKPLRGGPLHRVDSIGRRLEEPGATLDDLNEKLLFAVNMGVQRGAQQPQLATQVTHRRTVIAVLRKHPACGPHHILARDPCHMSKLNTTVSDTGWD
ncbi:hypothetical protein BMS3Bbin02_00224 [bacterium BMS3Bbin02]|nr:hypothetical protein BMS3Bbin02_00224 [bacterium BMS3Bbin02]